MRRLNFRILFTCLGLYCLNRFWLKRVFVDGFWGYLLRCHLNDYIGGITILAYINLVLVFSRFKDRAISSYPIGILITAICGILWEYIFPLIYNRGTTDYRDVIAYVLGGITYVFLVRHINSNQKKE